MAIQAISRPLELLTFDLSGEVLATEAVNVREILDIIPITPVPHSQPYLTGLINVRGKIVPLADLTIKLGLDPKPSTIDQRIIVLEFECDGELTTVAIRADKVFKVVEVEAAAMRQTPTIGTRWPPDFVRCIAQHGSEFTTLLDLERIFSWIDPPE